MIDKKTIRKEVINKRDNLNNKKELDLVIKDKLKKTKEYKKAKNIFIYVGFGSEINTIDYINDFLMEGKNIFIPRTDIKNKVMEAVQITSLEGLVKDKYGILEPDKNKQAIDKNDLDLIIMPGVAFDKNKGRIGYGGGYYDKYLMDINQCIPKIALAYDIQIINRVPADEHDINPDKIITESISI